MVNLMIKYELFFNIINYFSVKIVRGRIGACASKVICTIINLLFTPIFRNENIFLRQL